MMDKQQIGLVGKHLLIANLVGAGIEVAEPLRDRGVEVIAYNDKLKNGRFVARPIQIKTAAGEWFGLSKRYEAFNELRIVFIWHTDEPSKALFFALSYAEALNVLRSTRSGKKNYAKTSSWKDRENYVTTRPSSTLKKLLEKYQVDSPGKWAELLGMKEAIDQRVR